MDEMERILTQSILQTNNEHQYKTMNKSTTTKVKEHKR